MFDFNSIYLFYLLIGLSAAMFAEGIYLLVYSNASYRKNINRRLKVMSDKSDRESVLVQLRRERGLTSTGDYRLPIISLNQLLLQSGLTIGFGRLILVIVIGAIAAFIAMLMFEGNAFHAFLAALFCGVALPPLVGVNRYQTELPLGGAPQDSAGSPFVTVAPRVQIGGAV